MPDWTAYVRERSSAEPNVVAELAQQLEQAYEEALEEGLGADAARQRAEAQIRDWPALGRSLNAAIRPGWRALLAGWGRDLRLSGRGLRRAPGFTLAAVATLALGTGLCVTMFALADALVLRPLPFRQPHQLVALLESSRQFPQLGVSWPDFQDWKAANRSFSALAAQRGTLQVVAHLGPSFTVPGFRVTGSYFALLGAHAELGRTLLPSDDRAGAADVVVVSWRFFQSHLHGQRAWLGRPLDLDGRLRTVVGVMPAGFPDVPAAGSPRIWEPLAGFVALNPEFDRRGNHAGILVLGRLRPGVSLAQARADMGTVTGALARRYPATNAGVGAALQPYRELLEGSFRPELLLLLAAAGLVMLIACLNVVNLVMARALQRGREHGIRAALGASRGRLLRAHAAECLVHCSAAGVVGVGLAALALGLLQPHLTALALPAAALGVDGRALAVAGGIVVVCALACALAPLGQLRRDSTPGRLHGAHAPAPARARSGQWLIVVEMAGSVVLLIGACLVLRSLTRLQTRNYGFQPQGTLSFTVGLTAQYATGAERMRFFREAERRLEHLPGVAAAAGAFPLPLAGFQAQDPFFITGRPQPAKGREPVADVVFTRGDYLGTMRIPLLAGRRLALSDTAAAPAVAVVDETLVRRYFPHLRPSQALGHQLNLNGVERLIVGVAGHVQDRGLAGAAAAEIYVPQEQTPAQLGALSFVLRSASARPAALEHAAAGVISGLDPNLAATGIGTMEAAVAQDLAPPRAAAGVLASCALLALLLACLGTYGVISFLVARRTHEIGIRMALGASRGRVLGVVMRQGLGLALAGALVGAVLATRLTPLLRSLLYAVAPLDPAAFVLAPALLLAAAALACLAPARRATRVDPLESLRAE